MTGEGDLIRAGKNPLTLLTLQPRRALHAQRPQFTRPRGRTASLAVECCQDRVAIRATRLRRHEQRGVHDPVYRRRSLKTYRRLSTGDRYMCYGVYRRLREVREMPQTFTLNNRRLTAEPFETAWVLRGERGALYLLVPVSTDRALFATATGPARGVCFRENNGALEVVPGIRSVPM